MSKDFNEKDVLTILSEHKLLKKLKGPIDQLPLQEIVKQFNDYSANYFLAKERLERGSNDFEWRHLDIDEIKSDLMKMQGSISNLNKCIAGIEKRTHRFRYFVREEYYHDESLYPILTETISGLLKNSIAVLEWYANSTLERIRLYDQRKEGRPVKSIALQLLVKNLAYSFIDLTNRKPPITQEGAFARFVIGFLEHIGESEIEVNSTIRELLSPRKKPH